MFEIFYWAAFVGRNDIVQCIIKNGYSPFVKPHKTLLNAIFGCVRGNQYETLKLIFSFNLITQDQEQFFQSREGRDSFGNTVMHLAYQLKREKIAKLLEDMGFNDQLKIVRNYRGLLPEDMNHCTKDIEDFEERAKLKRLVDNELADPMGLMSRKTLKQLIRN